MPFKGDMRLGGPHDNEVGLRGSSEGNGEGFPPYGTFHQTLTGQEYPIAEGGASFFFSEWNSYDVPSQICDVDELHDGAGGYFIDWSTATNVSFVEEGTAFYEGPEFPSDPVEVPSGSGNYYDSAVSRLDYLHDGTGGYFSNQVFVHYYPNGTLIADVPETGEVPISSGNYYSNGKYTRYNWDGSGGYVELTNQGSFNSNGTVIAGGDSEELEVPSGSALYFGTGRYSNYVWDGSGGYTTTFPNGSYHEYGTFITSDESYNYYWGGDGSYYSEPI